MASVELARRSLHLKLYPSPQTFSHRREVLRIISNYGEVSMFRSFKYHPTSPINDAFTAIFSTTAGAQALLDASPVNYRVIPKPSSLASSETDTDPDFLNFSLHISPTKFSHEEFVTSRFTNPLHSTFYPKPARLSLIGSALEAYITPDNYIEPGLLDWDTERGRGILRVRNSRQVNTPGKMIQDFLREQKEARSAKVTKQD